ncbi:WD40-repeat-containing domain protein [Chiua virens]|nr:WD40-repeat-containing domain protein [Chiua virens]
MLHLAFHVVLPDNAAKPNAPTQIVISKSIQDDVLNHPSQAFSEKKKSCRAMCTTVRLQSPATRCSSTLSGHSSPILCASFPPTGALPATGSGDTHVRLWDLNTETRSHTLVGHTGWVLCVEWEPIERKLASGGDDVHVKLWHPRSGKPICDAMKGHSKWVTWEPVHINPAAPRLASSSKDGTVRVWSSAMRRLECTLGGHTASVNVVKCEGGGIGGKGVLCTASSDRAGRQLTIVKDHAHWVTTLALNTDFVLRFDHTGKRPASDEEAQSQVLERYEALIAHTPELLISGSTPSSCSPYSHPHPTQGTRSGIVREERIRLFWCPCSAASDAQSDVVDLGMMGKFVATLCEYVGTDLICYRTSEEGSKRGRSDSVLLLRFQKQKLFRLLPDHGFDSEDLPNKILQEKCKGTFLLHDHRKLEQFLSLTVGYFVGN